MPVATLDPRSGDLVPSAGTEAPVLVVCLSDDEEIEALRASVTAAR